MRAILLSRDLLFISKIREVVTAKGHELLVIKSAETLVDTLRSAEQSGILLVDLEKAPVSLEVVAESYRGLQGSGWRCYSFFSHVRIDTGAAAESLGLGDVMPRSRFVRILPDLFSSK